MTLRPLFAVAALLLASLSLASCRPAEAEANEVRYRLTVEGMTCAVGCAPKVKKSLESIDGVRSVEIDFETQTALVTAKEGTELTVEACDGSFANDGYFVSELVLLEADPAAESDTEN